MAPLSRRAETLHLPETADRGGGPMGRTERIASLVGGGLLVHWGLRRGGLTGLAGTLAGGAIAWMGINGRTGGQFDSDFNRFGTSMEGAVGGRETEGAGGDGREREGAVSGGREKPLPM